MKRKKASGYDDVPISLIIDGASEISKPLSNLINRCLESSVFPSSEKCAKITPIYKSGDKSVMNNYRPISVFRQFGFRERPSTQHAVTILSDSIRRNMDKGLVTGAVFLDLRKAFDTVDHSRILSKLLLYGIRNEELAWCESYLFDRKQFVQYDGYASETRHIPCGVPQGSILGPLLFIILINDINSGLKQCDVNYLC